MKTIFTYFIAILSGGLFLMSCEKQEKEDRNQAVGYVTLQSKSPKKGVAFNFNLPENHLPLLGPAISWDYNWGISTSAKFQKYLNEYGIDFCPMTWNANWNQEALRQYMTVNPDARYLLAFNEPNLTDQAKLTPAEAASHWGKVVSTARELGLKIIAPAMNYGTLADYHDPWKWLDEFFAQPGVSLDDVDGIAIHCYMPSPDAVKGYIAKFKKYGKPIWLTEFCAWDRPVSESEQMSYLVNMLNYLEQDDDIFRYAWFIPKGNGNSVCHNSLLTAIEPCDLTPLGTLFVNMSSFDKNFRYKITDVIPAEHYAGLEGDISLSVCTDSKGLLEINGFKKGMGVSYRIDASENVSSIELRYSSFFISSVNVLVDGTVAATVELPSTDDRWMSHSFPVTIGKGIHTLTLQGDSGFPVKLNYMRLNK